MNPTQMTARVTATVDGLTSRWGAGAIRWIAAILWLGNVSWKRPPDFGRTAGGCRALCRYVEHGIDHPVLPGSAWLFEHVISPHLWAFGWFTILGEGLVAVLLAAGRFRRTAAVAGIALSIGILAAVANAPGEWYWSYLLMIALHVAVLVTTPESPEPPARSMAFATTGFGVLMVVAHVGEGLAGTAFTIFGSGAPFPGDLVRNLFGGSMALGLVVAAIGIACLAVLPKVGATLSRRIGAGIAVAAAVMFLTYGSDGTAIGLGSTTTTACVLAALGVALALVPRAELPTE
jgi:hypothetical protein